MSEQGFSKGEACNRGGCTGIIAEHDKEGSCSCHINPPCSNCVNPKEYCPACGWDAEEESRSLPRYEPTEAQLKQWEKEREEARVLEEIFMKKYNGELVADKIEIRSKSHTHFSMIKYGVFPKGTTADKIRPLVNGTFGGRFTRYNDYSFEFVAYTD